MSPPTLRAAEQRAGSARTSPVAKRTEKSTGHSRTNRGEWAFRRYWSDRNPFPDYGPPDEGSIMKNFVTKVGQVGNHVFGNFLDNPSRQPDAQKPPAKRPSESTSTQTSKRLRNDSGPKTMEVISVDGTSDTLEMDRSANSTGKRNMNHQGSQSLRSSDNRHPNSAIDEYRSTSTHTGLQVSRKRSRHQKKGQVPANGGHEMNSVKPSSHEIATQPRFKTSGRPLLSQSEQANDRIEDDEVEVVSGGSRSGPAKGHGDALYKKSVFAVIHDPSSEDELNEVAPPPSKTKMRHRMYQTTKPNEHRGNQANNGLKRAPGSPDALQDEHPTKRRHEPLSEANISRTKFSASTMGSTRGRPDAFRVKKAVCDPGFVYPAAGNMREGADGASNVPCFLLPGGNNPHHSIVTDDNGAELEALEWIMPNLARVRTISHHSRSPIVKVASVTGIDSSAKFPKGAATLIEFDSVQEADNWVEICHRANKDIELRIDDRVNLRAVMDKKIKQIREWTLKQSLPLPQNMQLLARQAEIGQHARQKANESSLSQARQLEAPARPKSLRAHMRADDDLDSQALNNTEHAQNEEQSEHDNTQTDRMKRSLRRPQETQRSLRSVKPKAPSPTPPPPERWTEQNPHWIEERNYKISLIYERTTINATDIERLDEGQFLNDEIISFYAKYLHKGLEARNEQVAKKVYVFSSFFWEKLRSSGYDGVKGWTTKVDVTSFDYIVVPINQSAHWYLAIICNPGALLPRAESTGQDGDAGNSAAAGEKDRDQVFVEGETSSKIERVTSSLAHISFDEQQVDGSVAIDLDNPKATPSTKKSKSTKKGPGPRKYHPKDPRVIVLDSLDGAHTNVATTLKTYLKNEIKHRKDVDIELPQQFGMAAKDIPFQNNFTDCGVYLLGYLEEFMKGPHEFTKKILQHESRDWDVNASAMRNRIRNVIFDLQAEYCKELKRQKREKKLASKQKKAESQTPPALPEASLHQDASELPIKTSSVTSPSGANSRQQTPVHALINSDRQIEATPIVGRRNATISPPPSQRKQASPRQSVAKSSPVVPLSCRSGIVPQTADSNDRIIDNANQSEESGATASKQQVKTSSAHLVTEESPVLKTSSSSDSDSEVLNAGASMVVHLSQSMESKDAVSSQPKEQTLSSQEMARSGQRLEPSFVSASKPETASVAGKIGRPIMSSEVKGAQKIAEQDLVSRLPKLRESGKLAAQTQPRPSESSDSPTPQETPQPPETPTMLDGNYDERSFLAPIPSSPPSAVPIPLSATSRTAPKGRSDRNEHSSTKNTIKDSALRQNGERSRYWPSTTDASAKQGKFSRQTVVPSSSNDESMARTGTTSKEERKRRRRTHDGKRGLIKANNDGDDKRSRSSPTIDLTID